MNMKTEFTPDCMRVLLLFSQKYTRYGILHKMKISPSFTLGQTKVIFAPFFFGGGGADMKTFLSFKTIVRMVYIIIYQYF